MKNQSDKEGLSPRHRKFADLFIGGMPAGRAYENAGYSAKGNSAVVCAGKLLTNVNVKAYVRKRRRELAEADQFEKWQLIEFLTRIITTPVGQVDENSDLAQEVTRMEIGENVVQTKIKIAGKLEAGKQLATLLNWNEPEKITLDATDRLASLMERLRK